MAQALELTVEISIHAPREGCDLPGAAPSFRGAKISIHAPREGCDHCVLYYRHKDKDFNPRTP